MRTIQKTVYKFSELSDSAKEKAIQNLSGVNVNFQWWEFIYSDAEEIGLKITGFDLDRNRHCKGKLIDSAYCIARTIVNQHGEKCNTYETAKKLISETNELVKKYSDGIKTDSVAEGNEYEFDKEADELEAEFTKDLLECYSIMLQKEYEYLTSENAIIETIEANEWEFYENGQRF